MRSKQDSKYPKFYAIENYKRPLDKSFHSGKLMINLCEHGQQ